LSNIGANRLFDKLAQLGNKQKDFQDALNKAMAWLKDVTPRVQKVLSEPIAGEPRLVEDQLNRAKALQNEILSNGRLIEAVRQATNSLLNSMEELSPSERDAVEKTTRELESKYQNLLEAVGNKITDLDSALVQSQGLQDAVDGVSNWLTQAEYQLKYDQHFFKSFIYVINYLFFSFYLINIGTLTNQPVLLERDLMSKLEKLKCYRLTLTLIDQASKVWQDLLMIYCDPAMLPSPRK
jgi:uncharacterized protein YoxC